MVESKNSCSYIVIIAIWLILQSILGHISSDIVNLKKQASFSLFMFHKHKT